MDRDRPDGAHPPDASANDSARVQEKASAAAAERKFLAAREAWFRGRGIKKAGG